MFCLAELKPLLVTDGSRPTLRACSAQHPKLTGANGERWLPAISKAPSLGLKLFDGDFSSAIDPGTATFTVKLDILALSGIDVGQCRWAGAKFSLYAAPGLTMQDRSATPATTLNVFNGIVDSFSIDANALAITAKIDTSPFDVDAMTLTYAGTGGIEGGADLKGQLKPWILGNALNVEPKLIDSDNSVLQFSAYGAIAAVDALYERGSSFGASVGDFATYDALVAAAIPAGRWGTCLAQGLVRLGAPPYGVITGDIQGDAVGGVHPRLTGAIIKRVATHAGVTLDQIDTASLDALDAAVPYPINIVLTEQTSVLELAQRLARPCNAQAGVGWTGKLFATRVSLGEPVITLDAAGRRLPPVQKSTESSVSPPYKRIQMGGQRAWRVQTLDEIAFEAPLLDRGLYDAATTYREGNIVELQDGSRWLYVATTAGKGNSPTTGSTYWSSLNGPTVVDWSQGVTGPGKPADNATNSADPGSPFGDGTVGDALDSIAGKVAIDLTAPPIPAGLHLTSTLSTAADGTQRVTLVATWNAPVPLPDDMANIVLALKETAGGGYVEFALGATATRYEKQVAPNTVYYGKVQAVDTQGNASGYSAEVSTTSVRDTTPPAPPTALTASSGIGSVFLDWTNPADADLAKAIVYAAPVNDITQHTKSQTVNASPSTVGGCSFTGLTTGVPMWFWVVAYDTSGNNSAASEPVSATPIQAASADIANAAIIASKLADQIIDANKIAGGFTLPVILSTLADSGSEGQIGSYNGKVYRYTGGAWVASVAATDLTGQIGTGQIADSAITSALIADATITAIKIAAGAVGTAQLGAGAVSGDKIGNQTITSANIASYTITGDRIAGNTITSNQIAANTIIADNVAGSTITGDKIAAATITGGNIAANSIGANKLFVQSRPFSIVGGNFRINASGNLQWDACTALVMNEDGSIDQQAITANEIAWPGTPYYLMQGGGRNYFDYSTDSIFFNDPGVHRVGIWHSPTQFEMIAGGGTMVNGSNVVTGSLTADQVKAGSITADRLMIGDTTNYANNPDFSLGLVGWSFQSITVLPDAAKAYKGIWYAYTTEGFGLIRNTALMKVKPGDELYGFAYINQTGPANPSVGSTSLVRFSGVDANGNEAWTPTGNPINGSSAAYGAAHYELSEVTATVPAGVVAVRVEVIVYQSQGEAFVGMTGLQRRATGKLIVDGAITASKIAALAVTADKIAANTITAAQIATGTITTALLAAGAITADKLAINVKGQNLVFNGTGMTTTEGWISDEGEGEPATHLSVINYYSVGRKAFQITKTIDADYGNRIGRAIPVTPGKTYVFRTTYNSPNGASADAFYIRLNLGNDPTVQYVTSAVRVGVHAFIENGPINGAIVNGEWTWTCPSDVFVVSPAIYNWTNAPASGVAFTDIEFFEQTTSAVIADGAITTPKLVAGSVTTDRLAALAVTADKIAAGTITGDKISSTTSLPASLTIGNTGFSLATTTHLASPTNFIDYDASGSFTVYTVSGSSVLQTGQVNGGWENCLYTAEQFVNGCVVKGKLSTYGVFLGLAPATAGFSNYPVLSYSWHRSGDGNLYAYENGGEVQSFGSASDLGADVVTLYIKYDGRKVQYYRNEQLMREVAAPAGLAFRGAVDGSFPGARVDYFGFSQSMDNTLSDADPAARINAYTTLIQPGKVQISGGTTLSSILYGGDNTKIDGGAIAANTITANKLRVGLRGITVQGINFQVSLDRSTISWSSGFVLYNDDNGNAGGEVIAAGSTAATTYFYWVLGSGAIQATTDWPSIKQNPNAVLFAVYSGGANLVVNYGGTIVDGANITTGSITAVQIAALTITGAQIAAGTISADKISVASISAINANLGTMTATAPDGSVTQVTGWGLLQKDPSGVIIGGFGNLTRMGAV